MFKITQDIIENIDSFPAVQNSDGKQTPTKPGYLMQTSGSACTVRVYAPQVTGGVLTGSTKTAVLSEVSPDSLFLNASATGGSVLNDLPNGITYSSTIATGTYTGMASESIVSQGTGATFTVTCVTTNGTLVVTSVVPVDHGTGYAEGDQIDILLTDTSETLRIRIVPTLGNTTMVRGYATEATDTSYGTVAAGNVDSDGSGAVATIEGTIVSETTNGPAFFKISAVDYTTAGEGYKVGDRIKFVCGTGDDAFTVNVLLGTVSLNGYAVVEMSLGTFLPFQVTDFQNTETSDRGFIVVS